MTTLTNAESRTALRCRIDGSGRRVVLLHPVGLDLTCFDGLTSLLEQRYSVVRFDLCGHGRSPAMPAGPYSLDDHAADVHAALVRMRCVPAALVGFSFGGMIAQLVAASYPTDVSALVAAACPSTLPDAARPMMRARGARAEQGGMAAIVDETLDRWFTDGFRQHADVERVRQRLLAADAHTWAATWNAIADLDAASRLSSIIAPTLCLAGALDKATPPEAVEATARGIRDARFEVLPDASHMFFLEQPDAAAGAIGAFLSFTGGA